MQILIGVSSYIDWEPAGDYTPTEEEVLRMDYKESANGTWLRKITVDAPSETFVSIPETQVETLVDHFARVGTPKTRNQVYAWFLEEKAMVGQANPIFWTSIAVDEDADLQTYLRNRFEIAAPAAEPAPEGTNE